ncbi:MAG: hypothetical protein IPK97_12700 [Ahniella sp.]|nr:hypothetical protein [Ahniella sp.]
MNLRTGFAKLLLVLAVSWPAWAIAQGKILADNGFRPNPHGFSFANWGGQTHPHSKLTPEDAAYLFGEQACARREGGSCVPTPGAKMWIDQINKSTEGGHCEGMAVLSSAFYLDAENVTSYGARQPFELKPSDEWLMRTISTYYATQTLEPVRAATIASGKMSLQQIVDQLVVILNAGNDLPRLGIWAKGGGHAVTPYKVEQRGAGLYRIHIYDNNYPGAEKFIDIDTGRDYWIYSAAALNPAEDPAAWDGKAGWMAITPLAVRFEPMKCPFCAEGTAKKAPPASKRSLPKAKPKLQPKPKAAPAPRSRPNPTIKPRKSNAPAVASEGYVVYTPSRCTQVQAVSKVSKQQIRMGSPGAVDSQIMGASMQPMLGTRGCVVRLPKDQEYDVQLIDDGSPSAHPKSAVTIFGPGKVYQVEDVEIRRGSVETVSFSRERFNYSAGGKQRPTVRVADNNSGADSYYEVSNFEINEGHNFSANEDEYGRVAFSDDDPELDGYDIEVEAVGADETESYSFDDVSTGDDGQVLMEVDDSGEFDMDIDADGDGVGNYDDEDYSFDDETDANFDEGVDADEAGEDYVDDEYAEDSVDAEDSEGESEDDFGDDSKSLDEDEAEFEDEADAESEDEADAEYADESEAEYEDEAETESEDETDAEYADDSEGESEDEFGDDAKSLDEDEADFEDEAEAESEDEAEAEYADESEAEYEDEAEAEFEDETEAEYEDESEAEYEDESEAESEDETEAEYEDESEAEYADESEAEYEDESEAEYADESEAEYEDESEAEYEDESEAEYADESEAEYEEESEAEYAEESEAEYADESEAEYTEEAEPEYTEEAEAEYTEEAEPEYTEEAEYESEYEGE